MVTCPAAAHGFIVVYAVGIILAVIRNEWVYQTRARIMRNSMDAFRALPTYSQMFWQFWRWNYE